MWKYPTLAVLALTAICTSADESKLAGNQPCDVPTFLRAQASFNKKLNIDSTFDWSKPDQLLVALENVFIQSKNGLVDTCNAYNALVKTLNDANIKASTCFDPLFLIKSDNNPVNAYHYAGLMNLVRYQCGAGFYLAIDNWSSCIQHVYQQKNSTILGCGYKLNVNGRNYPPRACRETKEALLCYTKPFNDVCNNNPTVGYFACESFRQYTSVAYPECDDRCTVSATSNAMKFAVDNKELMTKLAEDYHKGNKGPRSQFLRAIMPGY
ncbi:Protein F49C12.14 [Aphelenchoides avenae]|nr:Protein F49C12.14 [Aphelenchus avenae]